MRMVFQRHRLSPFCLGGSFYRTAEESNGYDKSIAKAIAEMGNGEEGRKGAYVVVVEVGREVTDFVRIFTRPMRAEIALSFRRTSSVFEILFSGM